MDRVTNEGILRKLGKQRENKMQETTILRSRNERGAIWSITLCHTREDPGKRKKKDMHNK